MTHFKNIVATSWLFFCSTNVSALTCEYEEQLLSNAEDQVEDISFLTNELLRLQQEWQQLNVAKTQVAKTISKKQTDFQNSISHYKENFPQASMNAKRRKENELSEKLKLQQEQLRTQESLFDQSMESLHKAMIQNQQQLLTKFHQKQCLAECEKDMVAQLQDQKDALAAELEKISKTKLDVQELLAIDWGSVDHLNETKQRQSGLGEHLRLASTRTAGLPPSSKKFEAIMKQLDSVNKEILNCKKQSPSTYRYVFENAFRDNKYVEMLHDLDQTHKNKTTQLEQILHHLDETHNKLEQQHNIFQDVIQAMLPVSKDLSPVEEQEAQKEKQRKELIAEIIVLRHDLSVQEEKFFEIVEALISTANIDNEVRKTANAYDTFCEQKRVLWDCSRTIVEMDTTLRQKLFQLQDDDEIEFALTALKLRQENVLRKIIRHVNQQNGVGTISIHILKPLLSAFDNVETVKMQYQTMLSNPEEKIAALLVNSLDLMKQQFEDLLQYMDHDGQAVLRSWITKRFNIVKKKNLIK